MTFNLFNKPNVVLGSLSLILLSVVVYSVLFHMYYVLILPIALIAFTVIILKPQTIPIVLVLSFFIGFPLIERSFISIKFADIFFVLLLFGIFSNKEKEQKEFVIGDSLKRVLFFHVLFAICCIFSVIFNLHEKKIIDIATSGWYFFGLIQVMIVMIIFSQDRMHNYKELIIDIFLVATFFEQIIAFYQFSQIGSTIDGMRGVDGTYTHHAMLGNILTIALSLYFYRLQTSVTLKNKIKYGVGGVVCLYTIIITGSRSGLVGIISASILLVIFRFKISKKYLLYIGMFVLAGILIFKFTPLNEIIKHTINNDQTKTIDLSSYGRLLIWKGAITNFVNADIIKKFFGIGFGNYYLLKYPFVIFSSSKSISGAHNNFLHVLIETGIAGFGIFITLFGIIIFELNKRSKHNKLAFSMLFTTIALLFSGLTQETYWFQPVFGAIWMCYAIFVGIAYLDEKKTGHIQVDNVTTIQK